VTAEEKAVRAGFKSRSAVVSEHGEDAEVVDLEQQNDNQRADDLGLTYDSDGRQAPKGGAPDTADTDPANQDEPKKETK